VFRDFPIESIHPNAVPAAHASECADDQGKFWEMHDMIFENQRNWQNVEVLQSVDLFKKYAIEIGVDADEFDSCMSTAKHIDEIRKDLQDGQAYGVTGTPGFFVGNEDVGFTKIIGAQPFSSFQRVIEGLEG
jgi:protein-disulfide isomerase